MGKEFLIAYDIGTSGTKASLFSVEGELANSCTEPYDVYFGSSGEAEQKPDDWWEAVLRATKHLTEGIDPAQVKAVSFSGQMMGCTFVDRDGKPIRRSIIWSDTRSTQEEKELKERLGEDHGYELIGHRISCSYSIEKLMWVKKHEPEVYEKTYKVLNSKDYIILKMTGAFVTDYSDASGTNGLDLKNLCWSEEIFEAAGLDISKMPELHQSIDVAGTMTKDAAMQLGLCEGTKVVCGGGDGPCATLGAGCIEDKQYYLTFGTSAWIAGTTKELVTDPDKILFTFAHVIPGCYGPTGTMQAAGASYSYIKNTFCAEEAKEAAAKGIGVYDILNGMIEKSPVGAKNLLYLPYPTGERSPRWNPIASGSFVGITMQHTKEDYLRAVIEGVAMNLEVILRSHRKMNDISELILTGGGAKGDAVTHILADVLNCSMIRPNHVEEATSMAAAIIAGVGAGIYSGFDCIHDYLKFGAPVEPDAGNHEYYRQRLQVFDDVYYAMEPLFAKIRG